MQSRAESDSERDAERVYIGSVFVTVRLFTAGESILLWQLIQTFSFRGGNVFIFII